MPGGKVGTGRTGLTGLGSGGVGQGTRASIRDYVQYQDDVRFANKDGSAEIFVYGKGAEYGSWISDFSRSNGNASGALIENPAGIIEFIARKRGLETNQINTGSFDDAVNTGTGSLKDWSFAGVYDSRLPWLDMVSLIAKQCKSIVYFDDNNRLKIRTYDSSANFTNSGTGTPGDHDKFIDGVALTGTNFDENLIKENAILLQKTSVNSIATEIYVNYYRHYGKNTFLKTTFVTASDSDNGDGTRDQNAAAPNNREATAITSQSTYGQIGRITVDAPFIRESATAVLLRNHLFDINYQPRWVISLITSFNAISVELGDIINIQHPILTNIIASVTTKKWFVRRKDINLTAREIEIEAVELA